MAQAPHAGGLPDNAGGDAMIETLRVTFAKLNEIQFDAPWKHPTKTKSDCKA